MLPICVSPQTTLALRRYATVVSPTLGNRKSWHTTTKWYGRSRHVTKTHLPSSPQNPPHTLQISPRGGKKALRSVPPTNVKLIYCFYFCPKDIILQSSVSNTSLAGVDTTVRFHKTKARTRSISLSFFGRQQEQIPWILEKQSMNIWSGFFWLMMWFNFRVLYKCCWTVVFNKREEFLAQSNIFQKIKSST